MPVYNAGKYVAEAIRSVLDQTFAQFELLIVDDGSTDNTRAVITGFRDDRIRLFSQENKGIAAALNLGLKEARGTYIARFDADDICMLHRLDRQVRFLEGHPTHIVVGSDAEYVAENGEHLFDFRCAGHSYKEILDRLYEVCPFIHSSVMYRKEAVLKAGGYPLEAHNFEDYLLWVKLVVMGKCCNLPEPLLKVRINPASSTIDEKWRGRRFRQIKREVIRRGYITPEEGQELLLIIKSQETRKIKEGAYHALCGKKFLAENYKPAKARWHATRAIHANPLRLDNYAMLAVSFLPPRWIKWLHRKAPKNI
jgi:glycosyltransferase involved in cell wall biosynthesis